MPFRRKRVAPLIRARGNMALSIAPPSVSARSHLDLGMLRSLIGGVCIKLLTKLCHNSKEPLCTENSVLIDYVTESSNVSGDDRSDMLLPDPIGLAAQVEEPT
jgi:hypothetical protein